MKTQQNLKDIIAQTKAGLMKSQLADAECSVRFEVGDRRSVTVVRIVFKKEKDSSTITAQVIATGHTLKLPFPVACILEKAFASEPFWKTPGGIAGITVGTILGVGAVVALCTGDNGSKPPEPLIDPRRTPPGAPKPGKTASDAPDVELVLKEHFGTHNTAIFKPNGLTIVFRSDVFYANPPVELREWAEANNGVFWLTYTNWNIPGFNEIELKLGSVRKPEAIDLADKYPYTLPPGTGSKLKLMIKNTATKKVLWEKPIDFPVLVKGA